MTPKQRDILLIPVPFTDLSSTKRRPVLVLSSDAYNNTSVDVIVAAITSNLGGTGVVIASEDMEIGTLPRQSRVLPGKIYTLSKGMIVKRYGRLNTERFQQVVDVLDSILGRKTL